ncbi:MAG TPA: methyltransferase domain-containing protein [Burkholderiaceae bacterium]|nr:methyltransferase domain-containing protein [Burkholderiaceae bacterium]
MSTRSPPPDPIIAIAIDRRMRRHEEAARRTMPMRREAIALLGLRPGESVLDVACGTGASLGLLRAAVGPTGRVVGVEQSTELVERARARIIDAGWTNVTVIEASMEDLAVGEPFDAVLFSYTHDVLQSPAALRNIFSFVKPGARVAVAGIKRPPAWLFAVTLYRRLAAWPPAPTSGLSRPWERLQQYVPDLRVLPVQFGTSYLARGRVPPARPKSVA